MAIDNIDIWIQPFGKFSQAENVADSLGEEAVYSAFNALDTENEEPRLPGFEHFTNDQMFFISLANVIILKIVFPNNLLIVYK